MPRNDVMQHMRKPNLSLLFHKREELLLPYSHFLVTDKMTEHGALSSKTTCYQAPLFLLDKRGSKEPNVNPRVFQFFREVFGTSVTAEVLFYYIYAVVFSPKFRKDYDDHLRRDIPRIPFVKDKKVFDSLVRLGEQLVNLHLERTRLATTTRFDTKGSNLVEFVNYEEDSCLINTTQSFDKVPLEIWNFRIGAYQVLYKWLKGRQGRILSAFEIQQFLQIIEIIKETKLIMAKVDITGFLDKV